MNIKEQDMTRRHRTDTLLIHTHIRVEGEKVMPYKNPIDQKKYMKRYMRDYRKMEREILRRAREMGIKPPKPWKPPLKPRKPQKRRR